MAKQVTFTNNQDITFPQSYWRVIKADLDVENQKIHFVVAGYKNENARRSSKKPIKYLSYIVEDEEFTTVISKLNDKNSNILESGYEKLSGDPLFQSAVDV